MQRSWGESEQKSMRKLKRRLGLEFVIIKVAISREWICQKKTKVMLIAAGEEPKQGGTQVGRGRQPQT